MRVPAVSFRPLSLSILSVLLLAACGPNAAEIQKVDAPAARAALPEGGISPLTEVAIAEGDAYALQQSVDLGTLFTKDTLNRLFETANPDEPAYSLQAAAALKYNKPQLHALLACKAAEIQREKNFASYQEVNYRYRTYGEHDLAVGMMLVRFSKDGNTTHKTHLKNWCLEAPKEAIPVSAVTRVSAQTLEAPSEPAKDAPAATTTATPPLQQEALPPAPAARAPTPAPTLVPAAPKSTDPWADAIRQRLRQNDEE